MAEDDWELDRNSRHALDIEARLRQIEASDAAAVQIGLTALRTAVLINAGAVVALLAFAAQLWDKDGAIMAAVLSAGRPFIYGLIASAIAAVVAYFYQSFMTALLQQEWQKMAEGTGMLFPKFLSGATRVTGILMISLILIAVLCFIWGAWMVTSTLSA